MKKKSKSEEVLEFLDGIDKEDEEVNSDPVNFASFSSPLFGVSTVRPHEEDGRKIGD